MKKQSEAIHLLILAGILAAGAATFWYATGNTLLQIVVGVILAVSYIAWGIIHHAAHGDLHRNIVIEYVLVGAIAVVLILTLAL